MSKSTHIIPQIINAKNNEEAIKVMFSLMEALHLSENYTNLIGVRNTFSEKKEEYQRITEEYRKSDKNIEMMLKTRTELNFLYRDIADKYSYIINKNKILFEEEKTAVRGESIKRLREDESVQELFKTKSASGLRDIVGLDEGYKEYIANASISYGLYQELISVLTSIRMFIDLLASNIKIEQVIMMNDVK